MPDYLPGSSTACYQVCTLLGPMHCLRKLAHSTQTPLHPRTTHLPLTTDLFQAWKTGFPPTMDCLHSSSTAFYKVSTLLGPTALLQNDGTLNPDISPPTDNSLSINHRPFPGMENRFPPTTDCLPASSTAFYEVSTLLGPTALPQNAGTLYPDTSPPTDNLFATNHRPFPSMENWFTTNYRLPSASSTACYQDCISVLLISIAILVDMYRENPLG